MPSIRAVNWCFTLNNYTPAEEDHIKTLGDHADVVYCIAGREEGGNTGTPHLQGFIKFTGRTSMARAKTILGADRVHLETARNVIASIQYCEKEGNFFETGVRPATNGQGQRTDLMEFKRDVNEGMLDLREIREVHSEVYAMYTRFCLEYIRDHYPPREMEAHPLHQWQQDLNATLNLPPDDRTITFVVDLTGNNGKTWFSHYYSSLHPGNVQVMQPAPVKDMAFALDPTIRVLFMDAPRCKQGEFLQYSFLESVKNGYVFCQKYESHTKQLAKCHVVVMMNEHPDMSKLSADRYNIIVL